MKQQNNLFLTLMVIICTSATSWAQCPPADVMFNNQAQLDDFILNYPNCTEISGNLSVAGSTDIASLVPLENITEVSGSVLIAGNSALADINDLSGLQQVGGAFTITSNTILTDVDGLSGLISINGELQVTGNQAIVNLDGLVNLETLNGGTIYIAGNPELESVQGLASIDPSSISNLNLTGNGNLSLCVMTNICIYLSDANNPRTIGGNAGDCVDSMAIESACDVLCEIPTMVIIEEVTPTTAIFSWSEPNEAFNLDGYGWAVLVAGGDTENENDYIAEGETTVSEMSIEIEGLSPETSYDFYVYTICNANDELFSAIGTPYTFTTEGELGLDQHNINIAIYPNPAANTIYFETNTYIESVRIFDLHGAQILTYNGLQEKNTSLDISALNRGLYLIEVIMHGRIKTYKLIKN